MKFSSCPFGLQRDAELNLQFRTFAWVQHHSVKNGAPFRSVIRSLLA